MLETIKEPRERLIVALDVPSAAAAMKIAAAVGRSAGLYKVGMQLYTCEGPSIVRALISAGHGIFLDLKYHDIPNTVASAVRAAGALGVNMLTVHAAGGGKMLRAAVEAGRDVNPSLKILAVTVLTSMNDDDLNRVGVQGTALDQVLRLGAIATKSGCEGLVASVHEATALRRELGHEFLIVTPGIRPAGADIGDQARVATPSEAIAAGATHIVVGRPITEAKDPGEAARAVLGQI